MTSIPAATFTASGLASGLDTNSIVDGLVKAESAPLTALTTKETALKTQVSKVATLASELQDLGTAAAALRNTGALAVSATSTPDGVTVIPQAGAAAGSYSVQVNSLAAAPKTRSSGFDSGQAPVTGGTLNLSISGTTYNLAIADGESLADVAYSLNHSGAPVSATVLSDGTHSYLSVTGSSTGYPIGGQPSDALSITETSTGTQGQALSFTTVNAAANASVAVDGLNFTRTTNTFDDVVPGATLTLTGTTASASNLVLSTDTTATQANLQTFVDAYNKVIGDIEGNLDIDANTDRTTSLAGNTAVRSLQEQLQSLISSVVPGSGTVRSLADLGIATAKDGSLSINSTVLQAALTRDPNGVNSLFTDQTSGVGLLTANLINRFTDPVDGLLTNSSSALNSSISDLEDQATSEQARIDAYKQSLLAQFAAMETVIQGLKATGDFLTQQEAQLNKSSS